jgi:hypothetical protein
MYLYQKFLKFILMASQKVQEESQNTCSTPNMFNDFNSNKEKEHNFSNAFNLLQMKSYYLNLMSNLQGLLYLNSLPDEQKKQMINLLQLASTPLSPNSTIINNYYLNGNFKFSPVPNPLPQQTSELSKLNKTYNTFYKLDQKIPSQNISEYKDSSSNENFKTYHNLFNKTITNQGKISNFN